MATKLLPTRPDPDHPGEMLPAAEVIREVRGMLIRITLEGVYIREKGRRLEVGPFDYETLYQDGAQRAKDLAPLKPRKPRKGSTTVSRGLLSTGRGR
jgi:hypothetical protein